MLILLKFDSRKGKNETKIISNYRTEELKTIRPRIIEQENHSVKRNEHACICINERSRIIAKREEL